MAKPSAEQVADPHPASTAAPLSGVRVIEIGVYIASPFAAMQLADLGAEVIKVEPTVVGDPVRATGPFVGEESSTFLRLNRNKRSLSLDLKSPAGVEVFRELAATADVLIENLRPGTMHRLGLGHAELRRANPRLIYISASGWGQDGPLSALPGLDIMAQARSGLMSITGEPDSGPVKTGVPICDLACGLYGALAAVSALRARDATGEGQFIDVSLLESAVSLTPWEAGRYFATGEPGQRLGSAHQTTAPYQAVRASDGWVTVGATTPKTWTGFCSALGLEALLADPRFEGAYERHGLRDELIGSIEKVTALLPVAEIVERLEASGVPCAPISTTDQVYTDDHLTARGFFWDAEHPDPAEGAVRQLGSPMRFSASPARRESAGPSLGGDSADVLRELGRSEDDIRELLTSGVVRGPQPRQDETAADAREPGQGPLPVPGAVPDTAPGSSPSDSDDLLVEYRDHVLTVTFNRPAQRNAMTFAMYDGLYAACERADADDDIKALVLRGAGGKAFVAGTDIGQFQDFRDGGDGVAYEARITEVSERLESVRVPTVALVDGDCIGGGLVMAAVCDLRIATRSARFGVPVARTLGNCLSMNSCSLLVHHLGPARALDVLLRARLLDAQEAADAGFVTQLCADPEEALAALEETVTRLLRQAPLTMWAAKEAVRRLRTAALPNGDDIVRTVFGSDDFHHGVAAFVAKEKPRWTGH